jgi:hypothetical protein
MKHAAIAGILVGMVAMLSWPALAQRAENTKVPPQLPLHLLKQADESLQKAEEMVTAATKMGKKERKRLLLEIQDARSDVQDFLEQASSQKGMLPAWDCCPCRENREGKNGKVEVTVNIQGLPGQPGEQPAPVEEVVEVVPLTPEQLEAVVAAMNEQSFSDDKLAVLTEAMKEAYVMVAQVRRLLDQFSFPDDKLQALRLLKGRITDPQNKFQLYGAFVHSSDKDEAKKILDSK